MKKKIYIDGKEGTTGLRIFERLGARDDIELILIDEALRKDVNERKKLINSSDITFLCLPDAAAREAVSLIENENVRIIDASTAHRTADGWVYGFPELDGSKYIDLKTAKRVAVPGCHASGFVSIVYPLVSLGILPKDYPVSCFSLTGYSGGGKKMIAEYEGDERIAELDSPRQYAMAQAHKHLPEMKAVCSLDNNPVFAPIVGDFYSGMAVSVPLHTGLLSKKMGAAQIHLALDKFYKDRTMVKVLPFIENGVESGFLGSNNMSGRDSMEIIVSGNDERVMIVSRFDNLGKGASGAAVQCMNIMLGLPEDTSLVR